MTPDVLFCAFLLVLMLLFGLVIAQAYRYGRLNRLIRSRLEQMAAAEPPLAQLYGPQMLCRAAFPGERESGWTGCVGVVTPSRFTLYERSVSFREIVSFTPDQLRWFGRPRKYSAGINEIWLHVEDAFGWRVLKVRLYQEAMRQLVRALKSFATPELVEAYRRRRPYVHRGPTAAQPAAQDIHGAWTLDAPVRVYLMPRFLVIFSKQAVLRRIPLETVQQIAALRRLDAPAARGLVRFRAEEETFAFALDHHDAFAAALSEAAKRTLEAPLERKQKPKDDAYPEVEDQQTDTLPPKRLSL